MNDYIELMDDISSDINILRQKERKRREHEVIFYVVISTSIQYLLTFLKMLMAVFFIYTEAIDSRGRDASAEK